MGLLITAAIYAATAAALLLLIAAIDIYIQGRRPKKDESVVVPFDYLLGTWSDCRITRDDAAKQMAKRRQEMMKAGKTPQRVGDLFYYCHGEDDHRKIERINRAIEESAVLRATLANIADEFVELHSEPEESPEADALRNVIRTGLEYPDAMEEIMQIKRHRSH
jgi:hypothetical protein